MFDHSSGGYEPLEGGLSIAQFQQRRRTSIAAGSASLVLLALAISSLLSKSAKGKVTKGLEVEMLPTVLLPYPKEATLSNVVICNFSGKDYCK